MADLSDAIKEAYASAPAGQIIFHTLEFRHSSLVDEESGEAFAIRLVNNTSNITAAIEIGAPLDEGEFVVFEAMAFSTKEPSINTEAMPTLTLTIDNVTSYLLPYIDDVSLSSEPLDVTHRSYLSTDLSVPATLPYHMKVRSIDAGVLEVNVEAANENIGNRSFPAELFTAQNYPSLAK